MSDIFGEFYNPIRLLSYGKVLNFTIGSRSIGKSTGFALWFLRDFIEKGRQFIYVRRTQDETQLSAPTYFDNAVDILKAYDYDIKTFIYKGGTYYLNGKPCGYAIPLSLQQKYKSTDYSKVFYILYDEFMIAPGTKSTYLGGRSAMTTEVDAMTSLFSTVDRGIGQAFRNECIIIFVGNAGTFFNPFFITYGIDRYLRPDTKHLCPKGSQYVLELTRETKATAKIKNSRGYKISTERARMYAFENRFADLKGDEFITRQPTGRRVPLMNILYDGHSYGVYSYPDAGYIYIDRKECDGRPVLSLTTADHRPNYLMIKTWHGHPLTQLIKEMYDLGEIRFFDYRAKLVIDTYLAYDI